MAYSNSKGGKTNRITPLNLPARLSSFKVLLFSLLPLSNNTHCGISIIINVFLYNISPPAVVAGFHTALMSRRQLQTL